MKVPEFDYKYLGHKWVACFDLLGFEGLTLSSHVDNLFSIYEECLTVAVTNAEPVENIAVAWVSDSFLFYSDDDSRKAFHAINRVACFFFDELIDRQLPVRGALACDEFYADKLNNVYLGKAFAQAYRCAENSNWLGFVLAKSAEDKMKELRVDATSRYREWPVQFKKKESSRDYEVKSVFAYQIGPSSINPVPGNNSCRSYLETLEKMQADAPAKDKPKYVNAINFLKQVADVRSQ